MKNRDINMLSGLWARQLHAEFNDICWKYNIKLLPPVFEISKSKKQLGSWQAKTRTIRISAFLILDHCWSVTLNVLKHEIAHQICSEIFLSKEVSHGEDFNTACTLLGLPDEYRSASGDLPEGVDVVNPPLPTSKERRFIDKVEKLLALAKSSNEHEAALAMQKATELIEKYNIMLMDGSRKTRYTSVIINKKKKRIESYQRQICATLRDFFFVKIVTSYLYDPISNQTHKTIELFGSHENVAIAEYCYHFLESQLSGLWLQNKHRYKGSTRTEKNSYYLGLLNGFYNKLEKQKTQTQKQKFGKAGKPRQSNDSINSLIVAEDTRLHEFVQKRFPRLRTISRGGPRIYKKTFDEATAKGKQITLHRGVTKKKGENEHLLPSISSNRG